MALVHAQSLDGSALPDLPGPGPHRCIDLLPWRGRRFSLPPGDPCLQALHDGGPAPTPAWDNLVGAVRCWAEHPDWMDLHHPQSPVREDKYLERQLYLDRWAGHLPPGARVLDLGGGVGRFTRWLLDQDCVVDLVDPDLRSLWCALDNLTGRQGALDLHWGTGESLSGLDPVDRVLAAEVLCYVEDPLAVLAEIRKVLRPGGLLLLSVEARLGWALAKDAGEGSMREDGVVHVPGDRWVQTYTEESLRMLLEGWEILDIEPSHYVLSGPLEARADGMGIEEVRALEAAAREDPQTQNLNRAWKAVVRLRREK